MAGNSAKLWQRLVKTEMYGISGEGDTGDGEPKLSEKIRRKRLISGGVAVLFLALLSGVSLWRSRRPRPAPVPVPAKPVVKKKGYQPEGIVFHHSETPGKVGKLAINAARIDAMHKKKRDWGRLYNGKMYYIGYHYVILPGGEVEAGRPELCVGSHAKGHNNWLGVCLIGAFSKHDGHKWEPSHPTTEQIDALVKLCVKMIRKYDIPLDHVKRHSDVWQTWCPGERFPYAEVMARIRLELSKPPA